MRSTRRLPVPAAAAVGLVALALGALGACTPGGSDPSAATDSKSAVVAGGAASPLPPGKYQTLPQPCVSVSLDALKKLVPGAADYAGTEALTYDTDRRVGCAWQSAGTDGSTHKLSVDFERVVSYDPGISDEAQAELDFDRRAAAADIPLMPTGTPGGSVTTPATTPPTGQTASTTPATPSGSGSATPGDGSPSASGTGSDGTGDAPDLAPRRLADVGNAAFINDVLHTPKNAATAPSGPSRDVTLVFRTANVVVSITYTTAAPRGGTDPDSADLQKDAQQVAGQLESRIES
ncbi:hypothetical protein OG552_21040 [Streptomyces sp. NBC_01476]|uniref:hypothetical protein n=1 Tax=Streptomyces sp. NBC_01476 TaxID=2903881 RepID=UPI002E364A5A|nr:hypothetical protein [Streptomyces sp. NBC_01476]